MNKLRVRRLKLNTPNTELITPNYVEVKGHDPKRKDLAERMVSR